MALVVGVPVGLLAAVAHGAAAAGDAGLVVDGAVVAGPGVAVGLVAADAVGLGVDHLGAELHAGVAGGGGELVLVVQLEVGERLCCVDRGRSAWSLPWSRGRRSTPSLTDQKPSRPSQPVRSLPLKMSLKPSGSALGQLDDSPPCCRGRRSRRPCCPRRGRAGRRGRRPSRAMRPRRLRLRTLRSLSIGGLLGMLSLVTGHSSLVTRHWSLVTGRPFVAYPRLTWPDTAGTGRPRQQPNPVK